ncbi:hypothetical protein STA3757_18440 [Stanieria sp. NIES-3757]|nr:hypothetical protein STA3757_18440 [Stanieria sp. NIES-3757]
MKHSKKLKRLRKQVKYLNEELIDLEDEDYRKLYDSYPKKTNKLIYELEVLKATNILLNKKLPED